MKRRFRFLVPALAILLGASGAYAISESQATAGRLLLRRYADAVVTVRGTITMKVAMNDHLVPAPDTTIDISGTVVTPTGLVVSSMSAIDPEAVFENMKSRMPGRGGDITMGPSEYKNLRFQFGDGSEIDAKVVWKDADRDMILLAPASNLPAGQTLTCVDLKHAPPAATVLGNYFQIARMSGTLHWAPVVRPVTVMGIIERPHRLLLTTADSPGCPVFDDQGHVLGVCLRVLAKNIPEGYVVVPASAVADAVSQEAGQF